MARKSRKTLPNTEREENKAPVYAAYGYARISNDGEKSGDSIDNQIAVITEYVNARSDMELCGVITDLGFTGTNFNRPGVQELLDGVKNGAVQCVVTKDLSRLGRTYIEVGELLFDMFPAHGVRYVSINDQYDSFSDDAGRKKLLILFKNLVNHIYSVDIGKKIRSVKAMKRQNGQRSGGLPPFGYTLTDNGSYAIDPEAAETVRLIFKMRREGYGTSKIAQHLNEHDIPSPRNYLYAKGVVTSERFAKKIRWLYTKIYEMLTNEQYLGRLTLGKTLVRGKDIQYVQRDQWVVREAG